MSSSSGLSTVSSPMTPMAVVVIVQPAIDSVPLPPGSPKIRAKSTMSRMQAAKVRPKMKNPMKILMTMSASCPRHSTKRRFFRGSSAR